MVPGDKFLPKINTLRVVAAAMVCGQRRNALNECESPHRLQELLLFTSGSRSALRIVSNSSPCVPSGGGAVHLPVLNLRRNTLAFILCPTRELASSVCPTNFFRPLFISGCYYFVLQIAMGKDKYDLRGAVSTLVPCHFFIHF